MASWSATWHGSRDYMLCCAAGGSRLRFYAVKNGGTHDKPISEEFDLRNSVHRLKVNLLPHVPSCFICCCVGLNLCLLGFLPYVVTRS